MNKSLLSFLLVCTMLLTHGCDRRPLVDNEDNVQVKVVLQINTIVNVTTEIYNEHIPVPKIAPEMVRVMFYDPDTHELVSQSFISDIGIDEDGNPMISGNIKLRPGIYDMLCYNFDTSSTLVRNENTWQSINAYTNEISEYQYSRFRTRIPDERIYYEPDHLVVAREHQLNVDAHSKTIIIRTSASTIVDTYYVQVRLKNAQFASSASAVITGMSPDNSFALNIRNTESPSGTFFDMTRDNDIRLPEGDQDVLCAVFSTFGKIADSDSKLNITFNILTVDGKKVSRTIDLNDIFLTEDAIKRHWLLIDEVIEIPKPDPKPGGDGGGGGFNPEVTDWEEEQGFIEL